MSEWRLDAEEAKKEGEALIEGVRRGVVGICSAVSRPLGGDVCEEHVALQVAVHTNHVASAALALQELLQQMKTRYLFGDIPRLVAHRREAEREVQSDVSAAILSIRSESQTLQYLAEYEGHRVSEVQRKGAEVVVDVHDMVGRLGEAESLLADVLEVSAALVHCDAEAAVRVVTLLRRLRSSVADAATHLPLACHKFRCDHLHTLFSHQHLLHARLNELKK